MKSQSLGTTNLHYPNKQNYSNKLISQSSAFIANPATTVCSLHSSENDQTETNLVLSYLCLKCFPCSHVLKFADKVPTSPPAPFPCTLHSNRVLWCHPRFLHQSSFPPTSPLSQINTAHPSAWPLSFLLWGVFLDSPRPRLHVSSMCSYSNPYFPRCRTSSIHR